MKTISHRLEKIKTRLYLPAFLLVIALFVQPLPALAGSAISGQDYLFMALGRLAIIGFGIHLLIELPDILRRLSLAEAFYRLQLNIPAVADWIIKRQINDFFVNLALVLSAGLTFSEALPQAVATIKNTCLRSRFKPALALLGTGACVTDTLAKVPVIEPTTLQIVNTSEQSGKLAEGILHYAKLKAETIRLEDDVLVEWLPRLVYLIIAVWMAYSILGSPIATVMPSDL